MQHWNKLDQKFNAENYKMKLNVRNEQQDRF